ncbi:MAG: TIR domain-containing protein [Chloroflexaceae bacterium]|nr:TIR domain-containing protein [Chloroflexaceae bacterium]
MTNKPESLSPLRIFLCYAANDRSTVRLLYRRLRADGMVPWFDEEEVLPGQDWSREMIAAVRTSEVIILGLSSMFLVRSQSASSEVRLMLESALERPAESLLLVPLLLEACEVPEAIAARSPWPDPPFFDRQGYERLLRTLQDYAHQRNIPLTHSEALAEGTPDAESLLRARVNDPTLRASLGSIRHVAEYIWNTEVGRIIQDGTDHGPDYCKRLMGFAVRLLEANDGRNLSDYEMYLLLAGIYLHDIGMQCDVVAMPKVRERAEHLGARFDVTFTTPTLTVTMAGGAGGAPRRYTYAVEQQKEIRKNHHYLSAAWVEYASQTGETDLGPAAMTIPRDLVDDLVDVCQYHAGLPITDCPLTFKFDPGGRKQLVVALLRLASELDIEVNRVSIETINRYVLDPRNVAYWWLHSRSRAIFIARNVIRLITFLHVDDARQYGSFVHDAFITEFQSRNAPVLSILRMNGIPLHIDTDSGVEAYEREEVLPAEVVQAFQAIQQRGPLLDLADEVRTWLRATRYEVTLPQPCGEATVEMLAKMDLGTVRQRIRVRCVSGQIKVPHLEALERTLDRRTPQGWLISDRRVPDVVRQRGDEEAYDAVEVFTLAEFLQQKIWGPYFDALTALVEKERLLNLYVDLRCYQQEFGPGDRETVKKRYESLDDYVDIWLNERGKSHLTILGAFGTGKTWFCLHYADRQLKRYLKDPVHERLPLLVTLRDFARTTSMQQMVNDALLETYKLPLIGSAFKVFEEVNRCGKLLLILDGFDEMSRQEEYQTVVDTFWKLADLVAENSKVLLTSRTEYFRWARAAEHRAGSGEHQRRMIMLSPPRFEVLYLEPFHDEQIRRVITLRLGAREGPALAGRLLQSPRLAEMARKPGQIELLLAALQEWGESSLERPAQVYLYATDALLLRNIGTKRTFSTTADKLYFLCELAWEMIRSGELKFHYSDIPHRIRAFFGERVQNQYELDTWDYDLRNQTLLRRNAAGYYEFAHKSLAEYFVAYKFAAELGCLSPAFLEGYCGAESQLCELAIPRKAMSELAETFGAVALKDYQHSAIGDLLPGMMADHAPERLWHIIAETRKKTPEQVRYIGGNAATLLRMLGGAFAGADLSHTVLAGADLSGSDLSGTNLYGACLRKSNLSLCTLTGADLREADLVDALVEETVRVFSVAWSPDGRWLAGGGEDGIVRIWDTHSFEEVRHLRWGSGHMLHIAFAPTGALLGTVARAARFACGTPLTGTR